MVLKESKSNKRGRALTRGIVTMGTVGVLGIAYSFWGIFFAPYRSSWDGVWFLSGVLIFFTAAVYSLGKFHRAEKTGAIDFMFILILLFSVALGYHAFGVVSNRASYQGYQHDVETFAHDHIAATQWQVQDKPESRKRIMNEITKDKNTLRSLLPGTEDTYYTVVTSDKGRAYIINTRAHDFSVASPEQKKALDTLTNAQH